MNGVTFSAVVKKFDEQGEKTGWTYVAIPSNIAQQLKPGNKKSFRVKGTIDHFSIDKIALMPMGDGAFIMPLKATIRKAIAKQKGATVTLRLEADAQELELPAELAECLNDEPVAFKHFHALPKSHQHYFIRWIGEAKTDITKAKRIAQTLTALSKGLNFSEMLRNMKKSKTNNW